jgi:RimJ/RimL family protein N-acetyltransferase
VTGEVEAGPLVLCRVDREAAMAVLEGRAPDGLTLAPGYPSAFSLEVMQMAVTGAGAGDHGPFFMVRRDDNAVVGEMGAIFDPADGVAHIGYTVVEPSWGRGYATAAVRALVARLRADARVRRIVAETTAGHTASRRVMEKAGMRLTGQHSGEVDGEPAELVTYEVLGRYQD